MTVIYPLVLDGAPLERVLRELIELIEPLEPTHRLRDAAENLLSVPEDCILAVAEVRTTLGTLHSCTVFEPSKRLLELLATARAFNRQDVVVGDDHFGSRS